MEEAAKEFVVLEEQEREREKKERKRLNNIDVRLSAVSGSTFDVAMCAAGRGG